MIHSLHATTAKNFIISAGAIIKFFMKLGNSFLAAAQRKEYFSLPQREIKNGF